VYKKPEPSEPKAAKKKPELSPPTVQEITDVFQAQRDGVKRESRDDHPIEECMPTEGFFPKYLEYAQLQASNGSKVYHLGAAIPVMLNELNLRGFHLKSVIDQEKSRPFTVYSLLLGRSGDGKSTSAMTAIHHIGGFLEDEERENMGKHARPRRLEFDGTPEGLRYAIAKGFYFDELKKTVVCLYQEEFTTLFARNTGTVAEFLQKLYDGRSLVEHQRQHQKAMAETGERGHAVIKNPAVNGVFCSTPDNLAQTISKTTASGGLYGRLLIFVGEDRIQPYEGDIIGNSKLLEARELARGASQAELGEWSAFLAGKEASAQTGLTIGEDAHVIFRAWHAEHQKIIHEIDAEDTVRAMIVRATRTAWAIACLYATTQYRVTINADDAERACRLVDRAFHMGRVLERRLGQTDEGKLLDALVRGIAAKGEKGIRHAELHHLTGIHGKGLMKEQVRALVETALDAGLIVKISGPKPVRGPAPLVYYSPLVARRLGLVVEEFN
jgi:hypothetical protein